MNSEKTLSNLKHADSMQLVNEKDHFELTRLVVEHTWRVDNGYADKVHELYTDDGELSVPPAPMRGRQAIQQWGKQIVEAAPWRTIRHVCGNMRFVKVSDNEAEGTTVLTVFMIAGDAKSTTIPYSVGEDHDRYIRTEKGWRIVSRVYVELFSRGDALDLK